MGSESAAESAHAVPAALGSSACGQSRSSPLVYTLKKKEILFCNYSHSFHSATFLKNESNADLMDLRFRINLSVTSTKIIIRIKKFNLQLVIVEISNCVHKQKKRLLSTGLKVS